MSSVSPAPARARPSAGSAELHFLHVFPTLVAGGRELRAVELSAMLPVPARHTVLALDGRLETLERVPPEVRWDLGHVPMAGGALRRLRALRRYLLDLRPDLLLTYNWGAIEWIVAARLAGLRAVVHHEDGWGPDEAERPLRRRVLARRFALRFARAVVVPSWRLFEIARRDWRQPETRVFYLPNGVDVERFAPAPARRRGPDVVFGCVGGIRPEKNQVLAVEALARARCRAHARLRIVGGGPERGKVEALARERGLAERVDCVGPVSDTAPEYHGIDVFLIPSRTEQMPLALLEAMASGLPVIGTDVGDVARMVAPENRRWIVPPQDADALARCLDEAAAEPETCARLGAANRARAVRDFAKASCYGRYVDLYLRLSARACGADAGAQSGGGLPAGSDA